MKRRTDSTDRDSATTSIEFARAFCAGNLDRLAELLHPELRFRGPLFEFDSRDDYLASLRGDLSAGECRVLEIVGSPTTAAILYEYVKPGGAILIAQFNHVSGGRITFARLLFDTARM